MGVRGAENESDAGHRGADRIRIRIRISERTPVWLRYTLTGAVPVCWSRITRPHTGRAKSVTPALSSTRRHGQSWIQRRTSQLHLCPLRRWSLTRSNEHATRARRNPGDVACARDRSGVCTIHASKGSRKCPTLWPTWTTGSRRDCRDRAAEVLPGGGSGTRRTPGICAEKSRQA